MARWSVQLGANASWLLVGGVIDFRNSHMQCLQIHVMQQKQVFHTVCKEFDETHRPDAVRPR